MLIGDLVAPVAARAPERIAVQGTAQAMTYAELDRLANRFARLFISLGVGQGDRVGVHVPRSGVAVAALLGASRAGAVYVPLDPSSPPTRMRIIAGDCGLRHVVITPALLADWAAAGVTVPHLIVTEDGPLAPLPEGCLAHGFREVQTQSHEPVPAAATSPDDLAYLLYTSGSTGVPKGVMISHRNALAFVDWAADKAQLHERDRVASVAPFHFDLSVFDIWATLQSGATLVVVDETTVLSGRRMVERIAEQQVTVWYSVPSALVLMLESGNLAERGAPSLRVVFFAGEVFPMRHLRRLVRALPQARFFNLFGPTETNVCLAHEMLGCPPEDASAIPIGRPACGDQVAIVDQAGAPVPDGTVGELWVDGPTVMLGYWNAGNPIPAAHPYPTGDFVERRPNGDIFYHGRRDHMVKVRGFRIELGEVEATLLLHPDIRQAVALAKEGRLVAVVETSAPDLSVLAIRRHCAGRLPPYMVPSDIRLVAELPRTSSGKVDRVHIKNAIAEDGATDHAVTASTLASRST